MAENKVPSISSSKPMDPRAAAEFLSLDEKTINDLRRRRRSQNAAAAMRPVIEMLLPGPAELQLNSEPAN